ncbi:response regulator [Candidatus Aalborgicola defluviihabitans]|uniref:response regulator n=1 Tax=Candidatus Aalborgicola defluviihabitans TaxID=3386187 RepID=UPI001ECC8EF1|nr:response regulator [Burkholderiales bacterium]
MTQLARILLVEDNPNDLELTLEALSEYHLTNEVVVARDGQEAMDYLLRQGQFADRPPWNPAVVLLDLKLPKIDGMEVLRLIKTDAQLKVVPVVIMTASREERDLAQGYMLGANAYVVKPVDFHELIDAVKALGIFWAVVNQSPPGSASRSV